MKGRGASFPAPAPLRFITPVGALIITQAGAPAAICTRERAWLLPAVDALPETHPSKLRVLAKCMVAGAILGGRVEGPYVDAEAELAAMLLLGGE